MMRSLLGPPKFLQENEFEEPAWMSLAEKFRIVALELQELNDDSDELQMYEAFEKVIELNSEIVQYNRDLIKYNKDNIDILQRNRQTMKLNRITHE